MDVLAGKNVIIEPHNTRSNSNPLNFHYIFTAYTLYLNSTHLYFFLLAVSLVKILQEWINVRGGIFYTLYLWQKNKLKGRTVKPLRKIDGNNFEDFSLEMLLINIILYAKLQ